MKDKHTINLILISSKWFNSFLLEIVHDEVILGSKWFIFSFPEFHVFLGYLITKLHLIIARFHLVFSTSLSFYHPFITGVLHGGSAWLFVKDPVHSSFVLQDFSLSYAPPSYTKIKQGAQVFFILHSEVQFFLSYLLRWCYVILDYFLHVSWFTSCQEWDI